MKILVLTKRQYMGKDLIDDHFGRFRELPLDLARLGHEVRGLAFSYRFRPEGTFVDSAGSADANVAWDSVSLLNGYLPQFRKYSQHAVKLSQEFCPDLIWACSDAYHAIFGRWLAKRTGSRCVIDLYDNFEAFRASKVPGVLPLFRRAMRNADGVSCFSTRMANYVIHTYGRNKPTTVIESGIRSDLFYPQDRSACRQHLGLPMDAKIVGTAGAIDRSRGIETLFRAYEKLAAEQHNLHLAIAGPRQAGLPVPGGPRVHDLGNLPHESVPFFVNAMDVSVICYRHSPQGEVSFPQKAYEVLACRVPPVAAAVGSMNELFADHADCLYGPESTDSLAHAIRRQLNLKTVIETPVPSWASSANQLSYFFQSIVGGDPKSAITPSYDPMT
jgi:teichuronic acid biosynthesis glycosyltransferase TuaC